MVALYDYVARNADELSFTRGTTIYLAPLGTFLRNLPIVTKLLIVHNFLAMQSTTSQWFLGSIDRIHTGLIPANYVQPIRQQNASSITLHPQTPYNATVNIHNLDFFFGELISSSLAVHYITNSTFFKCYKHARDNFYPRRTTYSILIYDDCYVIVV